MNISRLNPITPLLAISLVLSTLNFFMLVGGNFLVLPFLDHSLSTIPTRSVTLVLFLASITGVFLSLRRKRLLFLSSISLVGLTAYYLQKVLLLVRQHPLFLPPQDCDTFAGTIMEPANITIFLLLGVVFLIATINYYWADFIALILAGAVIGWSGFSLFIFFSSLEIFVECHEISRGGFYAPLTALLLTIGLFFHLKVHLRKQRRSFLWGATLSSGMIVFSITIAVWQIILSMQQLHMKGLSLNQAKLIGTIFSSYLEGTLQAFNRIARRWDTLQRYSPTLWKDDSENYLRDFPWIEALAWYNAKGELQEFTSKYPRKNFPQLYALINQPVTVFNTGEHPSVVLQVPLYVKDAFQGNIIAQLTPSQLLQQKIPQDLLQQFYFSIESGTSFLYRHGKKQKASLQWGDQVTQTTGIIPLTITAIPMTTTIPPSDRFFSLLILYTGTIISFLVGWLTYLAYLTQQKSKQISDMLAFQEAILKSSAHSIISTDQKGTITSFNPATEHLLGYTADEMIGHRTPICFHDPKEMEQHAKKVSEALNTSVKANFDVFVAKAKKGLIDENEWTYICKNQERVPVQLSISGVKDKRDQLIGFVGCAYDLTARKELEKMKNDFFSMASHELRSPLSSIKSALTILTARKDLPEEVLPFLTMAAKNADRLLRLVNDLLDIQKIEAGKMNFHFQPFLLEELLTSTCQTGFILALERSVTLIMPDHIPYCILYGDVDRLTQVLMNLLDNAIKHSPEHGTVKVSVEKHTHYVRILVADQGEGIPKEFQPQVFQKFATFSSEGKKKTGTGLGLSISKLIIQEHHGEIGFTTSDKGCIFWFELPLAEKEPN